MSVKKAYVFIFLIILIDQISKVYIKTHFVLDDFIKVFNQDWWQIRFVENEGMAWGIELPGNYGKLALTVFRILAVGGIAWWLWDSIRKRSSQYLVVAIILIMGGAIGNIIDSVFYGVLFDHSHGQLATVFSPEPYGTWFHGKVVDMFYFPMIKFENLPSWFPFKNYDGSFTFFNAVFNVADVAISTGFGILLVFNKKCFSQTEKNNHEI
jgi:signal peptidase II